MRIGDPCGVGEARARRTGLDVRGPVSRGEQEAVCEQQVGQAGIWSVVTSAAVRSGPQGRVGGDTGQELLRCSRDSGQAGALVARVISRHDGRPRGSPSGVARCAWRRGRRVCGHRQEIGYAEHLGREAAWIGQDTNPQYAHARLDKAAIVPRQPKKTAAKA
ncbi:hypothetical protein GCM10009525_47030 [Streptosporangium amethystogenes subsp. fukuiense]